MTGKKEKIKDRRSRTSSLINNMLTERKQLLSLLLEVSNLTTDEDAEINFDLMDEFCQVLVDYIAAGHFGLYERLTEGTERRRKVAEMAASKRLSEASAWACDCSRCSPALIIHLPQVDPCLHRHRHPRLRRHWLPAPRRLHQARALGPAAVTSRCCS